MDDTSKEKTPTVEEEKTPQDSSFDRKRRIIGAIFGPICALLVWFTPISGLTPEAHKLLAIMTLVAMWWITEPIPIPVTSLLGPTLCVVLDVVKMKEAFAAFANPMIFLFMGGFIIAKAMMVNGVDKRIAYGIMSMKWVGDNPKRIFLAIGLACALCSGWISNTATAAMMFPIALGLLEAIREMMAANGKTVNLSSYKYATGLMLMTAYACSIGGVLTPIGTPPNIIMLGFLSEMSNIHVSFFQWMVWGFVAMVFYFIIAYVVLSRMFPADVKHIEGARQFIETKVMELGTWTRAQKNTMIAFGTAVVLWVAPGVMSITLGTESEALNTYNRLFPEAIAAMVGALLLFFLPVDLKHHKMTLDWKDAVAGVEWGTLLLFGGGLAMGGMMYTTGLSEWIGNQIIALMGGEPSELMLVAVFCVMALLLSELTSHTAATNMIGPLAIGAAVSAGFSPVPVAVGVALSASLGFMLPVSTPPNAIVYASGYIPITKMIKTGVYIDFIGIAIVTIPVALYLVKLIV
ncbi:SLC13 family permease [Prevotella sp. kh1p2]|uniref:SLC13 family permease n=1 Tax=Prevotella sp. kh1p2 TaxID=1761883 RepID=UPI0008C1C7F9|nr:DASS family sodium-coupled anion symporter [Prevotella sp. kh1p2]SES96900.1 solute carrier family 13 (sodium-dependent dicarboxylate transporter), member 2/3/5 [Prevotella sp. kh1p2]SNU11361.1 solute carrier family 13 (sodium-dependent dicarboxylate transporter), member 2/3/5 [Prevotellaceae bacterium KH2P17]